MIAFGFGYLPVLIPERKCQMLRLCSVQAAQSFGKQKFVVYYSSMYFLFLIFFKYFFFAKQTSVDSMQKFIMQQMPSILCHFLCDKRALWGTY